MYQPKRNYKMFPHEPEHRGNDKNVVKNFSREMDLVHKINEGNLPSTANPED